MMAKQAAGGDGQSRDGKNPTLLHASALRDFSSGLIALAEAAPERMTFAQGVFFLFAGLADLAGKPATFSELRESVGGPISRSLHTTYKVFLDETDRQRRGQQALGWLSRETDPMDNRYKYLRLTKKGREVLASVIEAVSGE